MTTKALRTTDIGSKAVTNESVKEEITQRIKNAGILYHAMMDMLWKWEIPKKGKICLFKSYYMPILTYGVDTGHDQGRY
jgi:hypothetical protein